MKRLVVYSVFLFIILDLWSQNPYGYLGESFKLRINADGSFAIDKDNLLPAYANEQDFHYLNQGGIWIYAEDDQGQKYSAIHHFKGKDSADIWPGPIDTLTGQTGPIATWNKVWEINKAEIDEHRISFNKADYELPSSIANWPSNSKNGFANYLAPFADANANKYYDPKNGDFPIIKGDKALFIIANDVASEHTTSLGLEIGIEIHTMAYTYNELPNTIFFDTYLISRKNKKYKNIKVGIFLGGECGNNNDNFGATLVNKNSQVIYNGDDLDDQHFGSSLPYVYCQFLNKKISSSLFFVNTFDSYNGMPRNTEDYGNYLKGIWLSGNSLTYGLDGNTGNINYPFMFPRNSDENVMFWSEEGNTNPGRRNGIMAFNHNTISKGDYIHMEYCISAGNGASEIEIFNRIKEETTLNLNKYRATTSGRNDIARQEIHVYPNPNNGSFTIENNKDYNLQIINSQGITIYSEENIKNKRYTCNVRLASGVYYLKLMTETQQIYKPLIITH